MAQMIKFRIQSTSVPVSYTDPRDFVTEGNIDLMILVFL